MTDEIRGPGGSNGPVATLVELMLDELQTREMLARGLVARLPLGSARHRAETELGNVYAARLALNGATNDPHGSQSALYLAAGEVGQALARAELMVWRAFSGLARTATLNAGAAARAAALDPAAGKAVTA